MAIKDSKKRIMISLDENVINMLDLLFLDAKKNSENRFEKSDYIASLIANDWKIKKAFGKSGK